MLKVGVARIEGRWRWYVDVGGERIHQDPHPKRGYPRSVGGAKRSWVAFAKRNGFTLWEFYPRAQGFCYEQLDLFAQAGGSVAA